MIVRPYGLVIDGELELGLEVLLDKGQIKEIRPHTGIPENFVVSAAFVNAHSHLEYRGMMGKVQATSYWPWIQEMVAFKKTESEVRVRQNCIAAAHENRRTGVAFVVEHSDRPFAATAMLSAGLDGVIFQETITIGKQEPLERTIAQVRMKATSQAKLWRKPVFLTPHAFHTVDKETLLAFGSSGEPISIHVAESVLESQLTRNGEGAIAEYLKQQNLAVQPSGKSIVATLDDLGLVRPGAQFVHCCDMDDADIALLAKRGVAVAHCPRSNTHLASPVAPVRRMCAAGIPVGLGLDSAASSGEIDMFDEMRTALKVSCDRNEPLTPEEVWKMATTEGASSMKFARQDLPNWQIETGSTVPLIKIHIAGATSIDEIILRGSPAKVSWV